jgi:hypothetical protein
MVPRVSSTSNPDQHSVFDFMNDEIPMVPSTASEDTWMSEEENINESIKKFNESIPVSDNMICVDVSDDEDDEEESDGEDGSDDADRHDGRKHQHKKQSHSPQSRSKSPEKEGPLSGNTTIGTSTTEGGDLLPLPEGTEIDRKNRLSMSADELLEGLHNSKLQLQGKNENVEIRKKEYMKLFLHADAIYSSPLTRALETAVLSMDGHRALLASGISLYSVIREVKRLGGFDTVGVEYGEGILKRLRAELSQIMMDEKKIHSLLTFPIDINDADQPWWTPLTSRDSSADQQERVREFMTFARYCDSKLPVFVGHSLFFKAFYSKRISNELLNNRKSLSENLKCFRLSNASMLAVTVQFIEKENGQVDSMIIDADLIFGGGFHGVPDDTSGVSLNEEDNIPVSNPTTHNIGSFGSNQGKPSSLGGSGRTGSIFEKSPLKLGGSSFGGDSNSIFSSFTSKEFTSNLQHEINQKKEALSKGVKKLSSYIFEG